MNIAYLVLSVLLFSVGLQAGEISFTMDDPEVTASPLLTSQKRNELILKAFKKHQIKGALFVCGMRINNPEGQSLLKQWNSQKHLIANHSYSHLDYNSSDMTFQKFKNDFEKTEPLISQLSQFTKLFRFPYLKEGNTVSKRDQMRDFLLQKGYNEGYVTIDASDWYVDERMRARLEQDPNADLRPYKDFYLEHIWKRAQYYDKLARKVFNNPVKHTLLIHHSLLNALFLDDLMTMFERKGWVLISAEEAFKDPIFKLHPKTLPAGESLIWAAAKETGRFDNELRYPGEDGEYEKAEMDKRGL